MQRNAYTCMTRNRIQIAEWVAEQERCGLDCLSMTQSSVRGSTWKERERGWRDRDRRNAESGIAFSFHLRSRYHSSIDFMWRMIHTAMTLCSYIYDLSLNGIQRPTFPIPSYSNKDCAPSPTIILSINRVLPTHNAPLKITGRSPPLAVVASTTGSSVSAQLSST